MKRILITQNENNDNTDYLIKNGKLVVDDEIKSDLHYEVSNSYINGEMVYENNNLRIKRFDNKIIIQSYYIDRDVIGRQIFYMFYIEKSTGFNSDDIVRFLKEDSNELSRTIDPNDERQIINKSIFNLENEIKKNEKQIDQNLWIILFVIIGLLLSGFLIFKNNR